MDRSLRRGFTLVELLVVVSIITLLVSMLVPSLEGAIESARAAACASNLKQIGTVVHQYAQDQKSYVPTPSEYAENGNAEELWANQMAGWFWFEGDYYYGYGILWKNNYLRGAEKALYCPSQSNAKYMYDTYSTPQFHPTTSGAQVFVSYYHNPLTAQFYDGPTGNDAVDRQPAHKNVQTIGSTMILGVDQVKVEDAGGRYVGLAHADKPGWNVMLGDTSVHFRIDPQTKRDLEADPAGTRNANYIVYDQALERLLHGN